MSKMIPHRALDRFADHPLLKLLSGHSGQPIGTIVEVECEEFFLIPLWMQTHPLIELLTKNTTFDIKSDQNRIWLPINALHAYLLGKSVYAEYSLGTYWRNILKIFDETIAKLNSKNIDMNTIANLVAYVTNLQNQLRTGLETGKLHIGIPYTDADWQRDRPLERPPSPMGQN